MMIRRVRAAVRVLAWVGKIYLALFPLLMLLAAVMGLVGLAFEPLVKQLHDFTGFGLMLWQCWFIPYIDFIAAVAWGAKALFSFEITGHVMRIAICGLVLAWILKRFKMRMEGR